SALPQYPKNTSSLTLLLRCWEGWLRVVFFIMVALLAVEPTAEAAPMRIRVRGAAKLTARASREQGPTPGVSDLVFSGSLTDDAGQPLPVQKVTIRVMREADARDARVAEGLRAAHGCDRSADASVEGPRRGPTSWSVLVTGASDAPEIIVSTDEDGRFCF